MSSSGFFVILEFLLFTGYNILCDGQDTAESGISNVVGHRGVNQYSVEYSVSRHRGVDQDTAESTA